MGVGGLAYYGCSRGMHAHDLRRLPFGPNQICLISIRANLTPSPLRAHSLFGTGRAFASSPTLPISKYKRDEPLLIPFIFWGGRTRTPECRNQNPVTYHLSTPQSPWIILLDSCYICISPSASGQLLSRNYQKNLMLFPPL